MASIRLITTKHFCRQCGWTVVDQYHQADLMTATDILRATSFQQCPDCLSKDIGTRDATTLESANPLNPIKSMYYRTKLKIKTNKKSK